MLDRTGAGILDNPLSLRRGEITAVGTSRDEVVGLLSDDVEMLELLFESDFTGDSLSVASTAFSNWPLLLTQLAVKSSNSPLILFFVA